MKRAANTTGYPVIDEILEGMRPRVKRPIADVADSERLAEMVVAKYEGNFAVPFEDAEMLDLAQEILASPDQQPEPEAGEVTAGYRGIDTFDARFVWIAANNHAALVAVPHDELEAIRVWQSAQGVPADVRDGLQISTAKIQAALARVRQ